MNLLHIDSSILGSNSVSRALSQAVVDQIGGAEIQVTYRDLAAQPIGHLTADYLNAFNAEVAQFEPALQQDLKTGSHVLEEFLAADTVVIGVAFYNFGIPSQLKAWIDRITAAGKTFRYTENGSEGLAGNKRVILAIARGGFYGPGTSLVSSEHAESYLRVLFGFLGVTNIEVVAAEGIALGPDHRKRAIENGMQQVALLAA
ncbi:MAG: FMN-dependent NADH-azoreductase [Luteimonas sp.]